MVYDVGIEEFLDVLVPCSIPYAHASGLSSSAATPSLQRSLSKSGGAMFYHDLVRIYRVIVYTYKD